MPVRLCIGLFSFSLCAWVHGVEYALPVEPREVRDSTYRGRPVQVADWGRVSETIHRDPAHCDKERRDFREMRRSDAFKEWFKRRGLETGKLDLWAGKKELDKQRAYLKNYGHGTALEQRAGSDERQVRLDDAILSAVPYITRKGMRMVFYDDRSPEQRAWLRKWWPKREQNKLDLVVASAWLTEKEVEVFSKSTGIPIAVFPNDSYPIQYGVRQLPAVIVFPNETDAHVREGLAQE